jgi:hypothetical protein
VDVACVWCKREGQPVADGPGAITGICDQHGARFLAEVDAALARSETAGSRRRSRSRAAADPPLVKRIADALRVNPCVDLCDGCLAAAVGLRVHEVESVVTRLGTSPAFLRDAWRCARCGAETLVTRARPSAMARETPGSPRAA